MKITSADFIMSNTDYKKCPAPTIAEYAFIGRSNVGKSSLINMLVQRKKLAKTSVNPGKTQTINHFKINNEWYLVDLPGYGFAKISQTTRVKWEKMIHAYLKLRKNLVSVFILVDSRLEPQKSDLNFIDWLGANNIPFAIVFTKADKQSKSKTQTNINIFCNQLLNTWETLPPHFISSVETGEGRPDILQYIENTIEKYKP